jgi:pimeloyl-ACP methyl ester carboxylesterase
MIHDPKRMGQGVPTNYTERRVLWILDWVRRTCQPDPNRWYCSGSSMGGCGSISFALRHPEMFAAIHAHVPIVSYTYLGKGGYPSAKRFEAGCWTGPIAPEVKTDEGVPFLDRMNGTKFVKETKADLPFVSLINGRKDGSIPWVNNPAFYRALAETRQGFAAFWDNGEHGTCGKDAPEDVKAWQQRFRKLRLDQSYPAFANTSSDKNPGNGEPEDGDIIGWMNRGMDWKDIEDEPDRYAITVLADYPDVQYPVRTDMTLRRVQRFKTKAGEKVSARIGDGQPVSVEADAAGRITVPGVAIPSKDGVRVVIGRR